MTITALHGRERPPGVARTRSHPDRRRRSLPDSGALTVSFEVTLAGESRYSEALRILDTLRQATAHLGTANLEVVPGRADTEPVPPPPRTLVVAGEGIEIRPASRSVLAAGREVPLTRMEFDLLRFLAEHPGRVFGRAQLLVHVWGHEHAGHRTVDVHIRRLRAKLGDRLVTTVRGVGYRLRNKADVEILQPVPRD